MNRYIMSIILAGNLVLGMDYCGTAEMGLSEEMVEKIQGIQQSAKETLYHQYPQVDFLNPKNPIEKAIAETIFQQEQWEKDIPSMVPEELTDLWPKVSGWYWSDAWSQKIRERLADLKKRTFAITIVRAIKITI